MENLNACEDKISDYLLQCILNCGNDQNCETYCVTTSKNEHANCPCQEKCPLGCPCENYECDHPEKKAVLALYSGDGGLPVLIQPKGKQAIRNKTSKLFQANTLQTLNLN